MLDRFFKYLAQSVMNFLSLYLPHVAWAYTVFEWLSGIVKLLRQLNEVGAQGGHALAYLIVFLRPALVPLGFLVYATGFAIFLFLFIFAIIAFTVADHLVRFLRNFITE